jgi:hypothetical protein
MKKLESIFALLATGFITMSMGFPTDLMQERIISEKDKETCPFATVSNIVVRTTAELCKKNIETESIEELSIPSGNSVITVKVFDAKGVMVMKQQVSMDEFLGSSENLFLPAGSDFVMFHESTAYYFLEAGLIK